MNKNSEHKKTRVIESKPFGKIEIDEKRIFYFPSGILAFEDLSEYALLHSPENSNFSWLQSLQDSSIAFIIFPLQKLLSSYIPQIAENEIKEVLQANSLQECEIWNIVTIPSGDPQEMTINQQGPILLVTAKDTKKNLGGQFISMDENHLLRAPLLELISKHGGGS